MELDIKENGKKSRHDNAVLGSRVLKSDKGRECRYGLMDPCMKDGGKTIRLMERADSFMLMETYMMVIGEKTKHMDSVFTVTWMVLSTKETGRKINNMAKEQKHGQMVLVMKETMLRGRNTAMVNLLGLMVLHMKDNSLTTTSMERVTNSLKTELYRCVSMV
jgi:hypothetical protein